MITVNKYVRRWLLPSVQMLMLWWLIARGNSASWLVGLPCIVLAVLAFDRLRDRPGPSLPALALAGLAFTGGALAKALLKAQTGLLPETWHALAAWLLPLGSIGTTLLMARFLYLGFNDNDHVDTTAKTAWWTLLAAMLILPWLWPLPLERTAPMLSTLWSPLWPVLLAAAVAWLVYRGGMPARWCSIVPAVPPGDVLLVIEGLLRRLPRADHTRPAHISESDIVLQPRDTPVVVAGPERLLARWPVAVALLLALVCGLFLLLSGNPP